MRKSLLEQLSLTPVPIAHVHAQELAAMAALLERLPEAVALVHEDLSFRGGRRVDPSKGRDGMAAEQVLRVAVLKQHTGLSYERLAFALADSSTYRGFCRLGYEQKPPTRSALQKNIKRVSATTWEKINQMVVRQAQALGVERGTKVRTDCLVVESNIHHPTDSSLLWDCVRVLARVMKRAQESFGLTFVNHRLRAKRRALEISNAKSADERKSLYRDLLATTEATLEQAEVIGKQLAHVACSDTKQLVVATALVEEIRHFVPLVNQVLSQSERRILRDESFPATEKVVSIFEPHTDIIIKDNRDTEYGHKICLTTGASALITDVVVEQGNPADYTLATKMMQRQTATFGRPPKQASFDGGLPSGTVIAGS